MRPQTASAAAITAAVSGPKAVKARFSQPALAAVTVAVTNTGHAAAGHSVLVFASPPGAGANGLPIKSLVGFERIESLVPGGSTAVTIDLTAWELALADAEGAWAPVAGAWSLAADNGTPDGKKVTATVTVA